MASASSSASASTSASTSSSRYSVKKSAARAEEFRVAGNKHHGAKEMYEALMAFNESICYALPGSEGLAKAYGNRSAVYFHAEMYQKCLDNVQLARRNRDCPAETLERLAEREGRCRNLMNRDQEKVKWKAFKLSYPPNKKIPFIVDCLKLKHSAKFGRHIVTTQNLKAGDIVAVEEPFITFIDESVTRIRCSNCLHSNLLSLIPCIQCAKVMYCSDECRQDHHDLFHHFECGISDKANSRVPIMFLQRAIKIAGGVTELCRLLRDSSPRTVFDFDFSNPKDPSYKKNLLLAVHGLSTTVKIDSGLSEEDSFLLDTTKFQLLPLNHIEDMTLEEREVLFRLYRHCLAIHHSNQYQMKHHSRDIGANYIKLQLNKPIGNGLFPFSSLFNHSCEANVKRITVENKFAIVVVRPIKAGDQLFISYGHGHTKFTKKERRNYLKGWGFECFCKACIHDYPTTEFLERKDPDFDEPVFDFEALVEAVVKYKTSCEYINTYATNYPCYEIVILAEHIDHLLHQMVMDRFDSMHLQALVQQP